MTQKQDSENISLEEMVRKGNLIPPTGHLEKGDENPLKNLSCAEMLALMEYFCAGKLGNDFLLRKAEKHLKDSVFIPGKCDCGKIFLETKQKQRKEEKQ